MYKCPNCGGKMTRNFTTRNDNIIELIYVCNQCNFPAYERFNRVGIFTEEDNEIVLEEREEM